MAATLLFACTLLLFGMGSAQEPQPPAAEQFLPDRVRAASATVAAVGMMHPVGVASVLIQGQDTSVWTVDPPAPITPKLREGAPVLDPEVLWHVEDRTPLTDANAGEVRAYYYAITVAHQTPAEVLLKSARRDLSFLDIFEDTKQHRGELVYIEGDLKLLRRFEPNWRLKNEGVKDQYEGWIYDRRYERQAIRICLVFTEKPPEIKVGEHIDYPIKFAGYLFKRYQVRDTKPSFDAPLLIGRTIHLDRGPPVQGSSSEAKQTFLIAFFAVGGGTVAVIVGLTWWYRRNDQEVRRRLANIRPAEFTPLEDFESTNGHPK